MKNFRLLFPALCMLALTSCDELLGDEQLDDEFEGVMTAVTSANVDSLDAVMAGSYPGDNYAWPLELMSDNIVDNMAAHSSSGAEFYQWGEADDKLFKWEEYVGQETSDNLAGVWIAYFKSIKICNDILGCIGDITTVSDSIRPQVAAIRAEAKLLRAHNAFILAQIFCQPYSNSASDAIEGLPDFTGFDEIPDKTASRLSMTETYAQIQSDMEEGIESIPDFRDSKYRFAAPAANALAARFYLTTRRYHDALSAADKALALAPRLDDVWSKIGEFFYISEFGDYRISNNNESTYLVIDTYSSLMRRLFSNARFALNDEALDGTVHSYSPAWQRFRWVMSDGSGHDTGSTFYMHPCFNGSLVNNSVTMPDGTSANFGSVLATNAYEHFEYVDEEAGIGYCHHIRREFSSDETLLTRAEARLFLGDTNGALADINAWELNRRNCPAAEGQEDQFRSYTLENITEFYGAEPDNVVTKQINIDRVCPGSDATATTAEIMPVLQCIQHLRRLELLHLGNRWFDIKRLGIELDHNLGGVSHHLGLDNPGRAAAIPLLNVTEPAAAPVRKLRSPKVNTQKNLKKQI